MPFDVAGARKAGYSDSEIADFLAPMKEFDTAAARKSGYDDSEIVDFLAKAPDPLKGGLINSMMRENDAREIESGVSTDMTDLPRDTGPVKSGLPNNDILKEDGKSKYDGVKAEETPSKSMRVGDDGGAGWGENLLKNAENGLTGFKEWLGGRIQRLGEATKEDLLATGDASGLAPIDYTGDRDVLAKQIEGDKDKNVKTPGTVANFGKSIYDAAAADIKANTPDVAEGSLKSYVGMAVQSLVQMVPTLAATFATRNPTIGLGLMAEQTYGTQYGQARNESNRTPQQARADATFYALAETIPEELPLEILMKPGGKFLPKLMKTVGAEAVQEMFTQVLESGYDKETINPNMTWGEAWKQVKDAGIVGAMVGGGMSVAHTAVEAARPGEPPKPEQDNSKVDAYIQHRDNQLSGGLGDFAPGKEPVAAANPRGWETNPISEGTVLGGTESTEGGAPALDAAPPADTVTPQQKVSVDAVLAAPDIDSAIAAASEAAVASPTGVPRVSLDQMIDETKQSLDADLPNTTAKRQAAVDSLVANNRSSITTPLEAWEPDAAKPDAGAVTPEFAKAAREHYSKYGVDVVFIRDVGEKGFDGAVDPKQPNVIFMSSNPTRAMAQVAQHEVEHTMEEVELPDGRNLNQLLKQQVMEGLTSDAGFALELHSTTAPSRASYPFTPEGQAAHADAVLDHLYNEIGKDIGGDAPRFPAFIEKVVNAVEERYGSNVATDVLGKLLKGLRETFNTLQKFFKPSRMFESDKWVNNLDQIHDTIAKMHAAKIGEAQGLKDVVPTAENVVTDAIVNKDANPTRAGPAPREGYAEAKKQAEVYKRWLGELDTKRRTDADKSPEVAHLRSQEKQILDKVHGREKYLTKTAKAHLEKVRAAIEARVNPKEDNEDMAVVRAKMVEAHARMAKAAEVTKEKTEEAPAKKPASGEPVRIGKPAPRPAETGNPAEEDRFVANQMAQDTGNGARFSPRKTDARETVWGTAIGSIDHTVEETPEFKKFFKGSEVVDKNGDPLVMYHATVKDGGFTSFDISKIKPNDLDAPFNGFWFTSDPDASPAMVNPNHTMAVYLSIKNPAPVEVWRPLSREVRRDFNNEENIHPESRGAGDELRLRLRDMGYDGVHWDGPPEVNAKELEEKGETTFKTVRGATYTLKWEDGDGYRSLDLYSPSVGHITGYSDLNDYLSMNSENVWVAFEPGQIKSATSNSGAFDANNPDIRFSPKVEEKGPVFFSALERAVDGVKFDKAPPGQWMATIKNMPGIKADEINSTGIDKWLAAQTRPVTKAEVLEQLELGSVKIEEVTKGGVIGPKEEAEYDELRTQYRAEMEDMPQKAYDRMVELERIANSGNPTKFAEYSLPGGENYQELLLTLPKFPAEIGFRVVTKNGDRTGFFNTREEAYDWAASRNRQNRGIGAKVVEAERANKSDFKSSHWKEANVLAHIRFDTRTGPNGEKILHLAEIQSDWHQTGRKNGYGDPSKVPALIEAGKKATDEMYALREKKFAEATGGKYTSKREIFDDASPEAMEALSRVNAIDTDPEMLAAIKKHNDAVEALRVARGGVPDAPFKTTWHELAFKRMLRYAAEFGSPAWHKITEPKSVREITQHVLGRELASVTPLKIVDVPVLEGLENDQIRQAVVEAIPVDVVNMLSNAGFNADQFTRDPKVISDSLSVPVRTAVARGFASALELVGTRERATLRRVLLAPESSGGDRKDLAAIRASNLDPRVVLGFLAPDRVYGGGRDVSDTGLGSALGAAELSVPGLDDTGKGAKPTSAELASALNRHAAIIQGQPSKAISIYEPGFDRLSWDSGSTNAERYDLSQKVQEIAWSKLPNGKVFLEVYNHDEEKVVDKSYEVSKLPDVVGKDIADQITTKMSEGRTGGSIKGDNLKVGGEGMKGFYDKILPAFVDKYVKKWGAKVEDSETRIGNDVFEAAALPGGDWGAVDSHRFIRSERFDTYGEAVRAAQKLNETTSQTAPVHSVTITPAMRAAVLQGQPKFSPKIKISKPGKDVADKNVHGFAPSLRVRVLNPPKFALNNKGEPQTLLTQTTTNGNAGKQLENLDDVLSKFKNPTKSPEAWSEMMAYALGGSDVPIPPYAFIRDLNSAEATNKVSALSAGQIEDATHGFEQAAKFRAAYESGQLTPVTTGKLFLWSFLSRGVSPYVQEGLFIDAFDGAAPWIQRAADGNFTKDDMPEYEAWARSAAPKGSGQPGAGATHNLNAFGNNFLVNMALKDETGKTRMQHLHEMFSDPNMTGQQIRREFMKFGEGVGIDNKVVSFTLLVAGHSDVMVIDRVQTRQLWDDGRFKDTNIYDGQKDAEGKVITGTPLANLTYGVRGLLAYEAIERGLQAKIGSIYAAAGRPQDASVGRYHWESWVAYSQQEASHGTLGAILDDALISKSNRSAIADVTAKQGEYGAYEYGARYGRDDDNRPFFRYDTPSGGRYEFSVPAFRAFLEEIKKPANGVVPSKFKVTASGNEAWYERPEVNRARLDDVARRFADRNREGALPGPVPGEDFAGGPLGAGADAQPYAAAQFSPRLDTTRQLRSDRAGDAGSSRSYTRGGGRDGGRGRLLKSLGVTYAAEWNAGKDLRESYTAAGVNIPARVLELEQTDSNARRFADLITAAKSANRFGAAVAVYPVEDYKNFRLMLADNGKSGVAVKPDGDIVSVFSTDKSGSAMMEVAVAAGGVKLDAFDTILPKFYHRFGFVEAARTSWNDEYAPEGWDKDLYKKFNGGKPDVVLMVLDPKEMSAELQRAPVYPSWDEAAEAQERLLDYLHPAAPEGATINLRLDRLDGGQSFTVDEARAVVEDTGARVIAERARRIYGKSGAPAVAMQLDRPLTAEEANAVSERLKQDAISQFADGQGEVLGPNAAKWGPFDPSKFQTVESASFSPRVPSSLREKMIRTDPSYAAMFGNNTSPSTPVMTLPPVPDREPRRRALQPIDGTGAERFRAINGALYNVGEEKPQMDRAARLVAEDPDRALAIAMLEQRAPAGIHPEFVFMALEEAAVANNDYALQERLSHSRISEEATTMGQRIAAWRNRAEIAPVDDMRKIREAREARTKARGVDPEAKIDEVVKQAQNMTRRTAKSTKKATWNDFIAGLICKT